MICVDCCGTEPTTHKRTKSCRLAKWTEKERQILAAFITICNITTVTLRATKEEAEQKASPLHRNGPTVNVLRFNLGPVERLSGGLKLMCMDE
jgi:hypothetical protein